MPSNERSRRLIADVALAAFALWFTLAQFGSQGFGQYTDVATEPDGLGFGIILVSCLALLLRRRAPWAVLAVAIAATLSLSALGYAVHANPALGVMLFTFASAPTGPRWRPIAAVAAAYAIQVAIELETVDLDTEDWIFPIALAVAAWLIGDRQRMSRRRREEEAEAREREQRLMIAEERTRIARELHDSAGHAINTIRIQAGAARLLRERDPERSAEAIKAIEEVARTTAEDIDRIVGSLREDGSAPLAPVQGVDDIAGLVATHRAAGLDFALDDRGDGAPPPAVGRAAFRIAQEALTNAARHGTGSAAIAVERGAERLELRVTNPVPAAAPPRAQGGHGIVGMRERAALLGGTVEAGRANGAFELRAVLPYAQKAET